MTCSALDVVRLAPLMERSEGDDRVRIGLIDGPVVVNHPDLSAGKIQIIRPDGDCRDRGGIACLHGTFIAGVLSAKRGTLAPAICPDCTLLVYPIFHEEHAGDIAGLAATPGELAQAIRACVNAGANIVNLSVSPARPSACRDSVLEDALDYAARAQVLGVAAAGNSGTLGTTAITRHPWVIPVMACDSAGRPQNASNMAHSIARRGLSAPGVAIASLSTGDQLARFSGTSVATPVVTGTLALLWSTHLRATAAQLKSSILLSPSRGRSVVATLLDAWSAY